MEETVVLVAKLKQAWRSLAAEVNKEHRVKFETFEPTFKQTYALLSKHLAEPSLDKGYIEMIAEALLFAHTKAENLDGMCLAALVLTERMLSYCAFGQNGGTIVPGIYIAEARKEVALDFQDVNGTISNLATVFDGLYWKNVNR